MEIGAEISKKIRAAIKGKLQELGAYVDEELPDYIMVMVANKKSTQQMADDLSLFLGNNTIKFTVWLHGVLEKLRSVAVEPASLRPQHVYTDPSASLPDERRGEELRALAVSSSRSDRIEGRVSRSDRIEGRVSSSAREDRGRRNSSDKVLSRLTSAVRPLMEAGSTEAVIDIKPEVDDDLIGDDPTEQGVTSRGPSGRPIVEVRRSRLVSGSSMRSSGHTADSHRSAEVTRGQERSRTSYGHSYRSSGDGNSREELSRKRKAPVASSVVRVHRASDRGQDSEDVEEEDEDDDEDYSIPSRVSLPSKPERKPSLPPAKQANKNLILKAISEAQESITKTTAYTTVPQRQTVPVAPRTRSGSDETNSDSRLVQEHLNTHTLAQPAQSRSLASRLQLDLPDTDTRGQQTDYEFQLFEDARLKAADTRSFILRKPEVEPVAPVRSRLGTGGQEEVPPSAPRMVQAREREEISPKFIVTLEGVPSPLASRSEMDLDTDDGAVRGEEAELKALHTHQGLLTHTLTRCADADEEMDVEEDMEVDSDIQAKRQKLLERCKFWPACKSGDECMYHHPTTQCKTFPNCKFGEKCLFIHPNCKYDAKCSKDNCPFTHVSKRTTAHPHKPVPAQSNSVCRFFPDCKKMDCPFYHPKPCRFAAQCKRPGCSFYHPAASVPPRHALKWTKTQSS
ncbi:zinc finger CCCH domain-containing protein 14 [Chanos chanos]|uniref:Zinc finger CCCH domain-containing protein 14 n=1 Tax=Chanos chanos TaxID=29144 RepID=A0A6J2VZW6_CHACN|nr:zinc finger CCCH domain-containing protein 14 [Chanos chanos]